MRHPINIFGLAMLLLITFPSLSFAQTIDHPTTFPSVFEEAVAQQTQEQSDAQTLETAWQEYYRSWNELDAAFNVVNANSQEVNSSWDEITVGWQEISKSWAVVANDWHKLDQARAIVNSSLGIVLTDTEARLTQDSYVRSSFPTAIRTINATSQPQQTGGTWAELDNAWNGLNNAWSTVDAAFAELDSAWAELSNAHDEIIVAWTFIDPAFQQISTAFNAVDSVWAEHR